MKTTELKIDGMTCGHCVASVTKALKSVPGVTGADVSLSEGRATVAHEEGTSLPSLIEAVTEEGYEAAELSEAGESCSTDAGGGSGCSCCGS